MKFSKMCDYKGVAHFIVKTGRKNIRILEPGKPYEKSFVVPLKKVSNRRPADFIEDPEDDIEENVELEDKPQLLDVNEELEEETEEIEELEHLNEYQPR
jgi:hypothetical protein